MLKRQVLCLLSYWVILNWCADCGRARWLGWQDSNLQYQSQSLVCYRYTTSHHRLVQRGRHCRPPAFLGWEMGLEPTTPGTTIRCSYQLSYTHHLEPCLGTPGGTRTPGLLLRRQLLYPAELLAHIQEPSENGAGEGNRTLVPSLEGWYSTIELHPQAMRAYHYPRRMSRVPERKTLKIRRGMEKFLSDQP